MTHYTHIKILAIICLFMPAMIQSASKSSKSTPFSSDFLKAIDNVPGVMDKEKVKNTLWLITEIKRIHNGQYRINAKGQLDCSRGTTPKDIIFQGKKQTIKNLVELEKQAKHFSDSDKKAFDTLFHIIKDYFDKVNNVLAPEAQGTHAFMKDLAIQFCSKRNRPDSLLLNWNKGDEVEMYRRSVTSFKIFYTFTMDLMNFLGDLIMSCPKALKAYQDSKES